MYFIRLSTQSVSSLDESAAADGWGTAVTGTTKPPVFARCCCCWIWSRTEFIFCSKSFCNFRKGWATEMATEAARVAVSEVVACGSVLFVLNSCVLLVFERDWMGTERCWARLTRKRLANWERAKAVLDVEASLSKREICTSGVECTWEGMVTFDEVIGVDWWAAASRHKQTVLHWRERHEEKARTVVVHGIFIFTFSIVFSAENRHNAEFIVVRNGSWTSSQSLFIARRFWWESDIDWRLNEIICWVSIATRR